LIVGISRRNSGDSIRGAEDEPYIESDDAFELPDDEKLE
jgi:hypothetical protein